MLRLSEIKLPLNHTENDLPEAILRTLKISAEELLGFNIYKRSYDARKKGNIMLIYQLDIELSDSVEKRILESTPALPRVGPSPDTNYKFIAQRSLQSFPQRINSDRLLSALAPAEY